MVASVRCLFLALLVCRVTTAEIKIAQINLYEIEPMVQRILLERPENQAIKQQIEALDRKQESLNGDLAAGFTKNTAGESENPFAGTNPENMKKITAIYGEKSRLEESIKQQARGELIKIVRVVAADRFAIVLDSQNLSNAVITKSGDLVDITLDVRDYLLLPKQDAAPKN